MNIINDALAMAGGQGGSQQNPMSFFLFMGIIVFIFYFLIFRPQKKRQQEHQKFVSSLQKGEEVVTDSGIIGRISGIADKIVTVEIADNVKIKILKQRVVGYKKNLEQPQAQTK
jgi:preprotein translocase subunit YajC